MQAINAPSIVGAVGGIEVDQLTGAIGGELSNVNLGVASRAPELVAEIRALRLKHKVLFFRDQDITRAEHVAFARHFGEPEDHPVAGRSREFGRDIANGTEARRPTASASRTRRPSRNGFAPNRKPAGSLRQAVE